MYHRPGDVLQEEEILHTEALKVPLAVPYTHKLFRATLVVFALTIYTRRFTQLLRNPPLPLTPEDNYAFQVLSIMLRCYRLPLASQRVERRWKGIKRGIWKGGAPADKTSLSNLLRQTARNPGQAGGGGWTLKEGGGSNGSLALSLSLSAQKHSQSTTSNNSLSRIKTLTY